MPEAEAEAAPAAECRILTRGAAIRELAVLFPYILLNRTSYLLGALFLLGTNACALFIPWLLKLAVESFQYPSSSGRSPAYYALLIVATAVIQGGVRIFSRTTLLHAARHIEYLIREELYARLLALDLPFFSRERTGDILSRFSNDLTNVRMLVGFGVLNIINTAILFTAALTLMSRISLTLTLCSIIPFPVMILVVKRISASMFRRSTRTQEELARLSGKVEENVSAAVLIRAYCREESEIAAFGEISGEYLESNMAIARLRGLMIPVMAATGALGTLIVLYLGGSKVIAGEMTLGDFVAFSGYLAMLIWPTIVMGWMLNMIQRGAASMTRLNHLLKAEATIADPVVPAETGAIRGEIEFRNLRFSYEQCQQAVTPPSPRPSPAGGEGASLITPAEGDGEHNDQSGLILNNVSLKIARGMKVGIVGPIGNGKTSLVRLVPRLFPVEDGMLFIDGTDVNKIPLRQLRDAIGYIPQESFHFSRSIRENIGYGLAGADDGDIMAAARMAGFASDLERFPDGLDTLVGERGVTLSGGQKQRAAIARALLKDPPILILDDPLSAVDTRTEEEILDNLAGFYGDRTVLIVSHRLSALRGCDLIVVLERGAIVEQGSHDELMALDGRYAATWQQQQLRREIETY